MSAHKDQFWSPHDNNTGYRAPAGLPIVLAALLCMEQPTPALAAPQQDTWIGAARVVDGDTMYIADQKFRLYGVDAPESKQTCFTEQGSPYACGLVSKDALAQKIGTQNVTCKARNRDQYGRAVAVCSLDSIMGSQDLNKWLVDNGFAVAYREYGKDYIPAEEVAKAAKKGIWSGSFQYPAQWRKDTKNKDVAPPLNPPPFTPPPPPMSAPMVIAGMSGISAMSAMSGMPALPNMPGMPALPDMPAAPGATTILTVPTTNIAPALPEICGKGVLPIKGNINSKGVKIYHMPGGANYDQVLVEPEKGESYFCNEKDAAAAGYRATIVKTPAK